MSRDESVMEVERGESLSANDVFKILNHPARRAIIKLLHERIQMTYSELLRDLVMDEGQFNFHLRLVKKLTEETSDGKYTLSHMGRLAYSLLLSVEKESGVAESSVAQPIITKGVVGRRVAAFLIDGLIFLTFTAAAFDPQLWNDISEFTIHTGSVLTLHPWFFHAEHIQQLGEFVSRLIGEYSHIFFAIFIAFTLMDSYKGQTPGRYVLGIRVVSTSNRKLDLIEAAIRNIGKVFLLPLDLLMGLVFYRKPGYIRFSDFYTHSKVEKVKVTPLEAEKCTVEAGSADAASG
ncbi:MAG: RDD family protein [Thaumarchaeota archaeon]|nr:RDD family protein [Nitrososphaerota archaeon]